MAARRTNAPYRFRLIHALAEKQGRLTDGQFGRTIRVGTDRRTGEPVYLTQAAWGQLKRGRRRLTWEIAKAAVWAYPDLAGEAFADFWGDLIGGREG